MPKSHAARPLQIAAALLTLAAPIVAGAQSTPIASPKLQVERYTLPNGLTVLLSEDKLVGWGWEPGVDVNGRAREPVPIPKPEFNRIVRAWASSGAACPP